MVKADPKHDYYADLELPPGADAAEAKKAFKKLAMRYHPDRNIGNEAEANTKFQVVQYAYEILTDPEKRAKYEQDRANEARRPPVRVPRAANTRPAASPVPMATNFPPPPRRTQPNPSPYQPRTSRVPPTAKKPESTSERYAQYANRYFGHNDDSNKAQASRAWEKMTHRTFASQQQQAQAQAQAQQQQQSQQSPQQRRPPDVPPRPRPTSYAGAPMQTPKARAGWDEPSPPQQPSPTTDTYPRRPPPTTNGQNVRRPGFFPGTEGGDEPPVSRQHSAYYNVQQRAARQQADGRPQSQYIPPVSNVPPGVRHFDPRTDPLRGFKQNLPEEACSERLSTPYATSGGEKTYFNSDGLNRSASTGSNLHKGWGRSGSPLAPKSPGSAFDRARRRSASPLRTSQEPEDSSSSSDSSSGEDEFVTVSSSHHKLKSQSHTGRRASADDRNSKRPPPQPFSPTQYPGVTVELEDDSPSPSRPHHRSTWSDDAVKGQRESRPYPRKASEGTIPETVQSKQQRVSGRYGPDVNNQGTRRQVPGAYANGQPMPKPKAWEEKFGAAENGRHFEPPTPGGTKANSPSYLFSNPTSSTTSKIASAENVDSTFSPSEWQKTFSNDQEYFSPRPGGKTNRRGRSPPKPRSSASRSATQQREQMAAATEPTASQTVPEADGTTVTPQQPSPAKFQSDEWARHFKDPQWVYNSSASGGSATQQPAKTKNSNSRKGPQPARKKSVPMPVPVPVTVTAPEEEAAKEIDPATAAAMEVPPIRPPKPAELREEYQRQAEASQQNQELRSPSVQSNGSAMDLDDDEMLTSGPPPVDTSAPSMEQRDDPLQHIIRDAMPGSRPYSGADAATSSGVGSLPRVPTELENALVDHDDEAAKGEISDDGIGGLDELRDTEPLGPSQSGLSGMAELATMLPFVSQASSSNANGERIAPRELAMPDPPMAPPPPKELAADTSSGGKGELARSSWEAYVSQLDRYLAEWHAWNGRMLGHFVARKEWSQERLPRGWTTTSSDKGLLLYVSALEEDRKVRQTWEAAWKDHEEALAGFARVRKAAADGDLLE